MAGATPADPQVSGSANPLPSDVHAVAITQLTQRVGAPGVVMPPALPSDVNAPDVTYHVSTDTPAGAQWGGEHSPGGIYVPKLVDSDINGGFTEPAQGGQESAVLRTALPAPVQSAAVGSATGGTLAAATYYYVITALSEDGESTASNERSVVTTGTTSSVTLAWTDADNADATGYKIYRGTSAGAENKLIGTVAEDVLTFHDTGIVGTTATVPVANTTASAYFTRTNVTAGAASNPYPKDVHAPTVTVPNPTIGGTNTPTFPDGSPSSSGDQSPT